MPHSAHETNPLLPARPGHQANEPHASLSLFSKPSQRWLTLAGAWLAMFLSVRGKYIFIPSFYIFLSVMAQAFNTTVVATLLSSISSEFHNAHHAGWLGTSYLLATCTFTPLYGRLCDILGRKRANQLAITLMGLGVTACATATSMETLILGRFITGLGGGGIGITGNIIMSDVFSARDRGLAQAFASVFNSLGLGLGGPVGGYLGEIFGWRIVFLIQIPLLVFSVFLTECNLRYLVPGRSQSAKGTLRRVDYLGTLTLFLTILTLLTFMSNKFNENRSWNDPSVILSLGLSLVLLFTFIVIEMFIPQEPILTKELFLRKEAVLISVSNLLVPICNYSITYYFPMWFQAVKLDKPSVAGLHILPHSISTTLGSMIAGYIMHKTGEFKKLMVIAGILPCIGGILLSTMHEKSNLFVLWFSIVPYGFGNACILQTTIIALLSSIARSSFATGLGFVQIFRGIGQVLGVAIASAVYQSSLSSELNRRITGPDAEEEIHLIRSSPTIIATLPPTLQQIAKDSNAVSLRRVFLVATLCTFLAWFARCFIRARSLDNEIEDQKDIPCPKPSSDLDSGHCSGSFVPRIATC